MPISYDIQDLFVRAFGIHTIAFQPELAQENGAQASYPEVNVVSDVESSELMALGNNVIYPWKLNAGSYKRYDEEGKVEVVSFNDFVMPFASLIDFSRAKVIRKTRVNANNGSVKEIYGFDDWKINVKGFMLGDENGTAMEKYQELLKWEELVDSVYVTGDPFRARKIDKICIEEISDRQIQGSPNMLAFQMRCKSDQPLELLL